ncbi:MAG: hypothetical protein LBR90_01780 [Elusimicrobiota bacterium]|jgi:3-deoxy-D-manno-octulosonic-acid transferase|nr:hypothetical protein [Elusimicrobiota bacterium]
MGYFVLILINLLFPVGGLLIIAYFLFSSRRNLLKSLKSEFSQRFMLRAEGQVLRDYIWIHAASVGEVRSVIKLAQDLKEAYNRPILLTAATAAGRNVALKEPVFDKAVLMPVDFYPLVKRFIRLYGPKTLLIVESDFWPNMIIASGRSGLDVGVINARLSVKSAKRYIFLSQIVGLAFRNIKFICAQSQAIKERYLTLPLEPSKVYLTGNIKYDILNTSPARAGEVEEIITALGWQSSPIVTAGSTHEEEERVITAAAKILPDVKFILTPRHLERKKYILQTLEQSGLKFAVLSKLKNKAPQGTQILLADTMGWLGALYQAATITFVGGSITKKGGHNFLEAAVLEKPVLLGRHFYNAPDVAAKLLETGGGILVNADNFAKVIEDLLSNPVRLQRAAHAALEAALSFKGATKKTLEVIEKYERK